MATPSTCGDSSPGTAPQSRRWQFFLGWIACATCRRPWRHFRSIEKRQECWILVYCKRSLAAVPAAMPDSAARTARHRCSRPPVPSASAIRTNCGRRPRISGASRSSRRFRSGVLPRQRERLLLSSSQVPCRQPRVPPPERHAERPRLVANAVRATSTGPGAEPAPHRVDSLS